MAGLTRHALVVTESSAVPNASPESLAALAAVATSTERVTIGGPLNLNRHRQLHRLRSGQLLFLGLNLVPPLDPPSVGRTTSQEQPDQLRARDAAQSLEPLAARTN